MEVWDRKENKNANMKLKVLQDSDYYNSVGKRRSRTQIVNDEDEDDDSERLLSVLLDGVSTEEKEEEEEDNNTSTSPKKKKKETVNGSFVCGVCEGWLHEPVTLSCGHTCCRRCAGAAWTRGKCGQRCRGSGSWNRVKVNVLMSALLEKWFPARAEAGRLRAQANELWRRQRRREAVRKLMQASDLAPDDHLLQSSLSLVLMQTGHIDAALQHAENAVHIKRDWPEGYYRMATTLHCLGRYEDAIIAYLQCLTLDPGMLFVRLVLLKLLKSVLKVKARRNSLERVFLPYHITPRNCHSSPGSTQNSDDSDRSSGDDEVPHASRQSVRRSFANRSVKNFSQEKIAVVPLFKNHQMQRFINRCVVEVCKVKKHCDAFDSCCFISPKLVDKADFECTLCYRLFWEPVTTPCGHVFCRTCLDRCLDHNPVCPLCKTSLLDYLAERRHSITEFIDCAMQLFLPDEYRERQTIHDEEMAELACAGIDAQHEVPIFVCTMAFPTVPCPLHVFEPRYRLMIRRCMESGAKKFGMCPLLDDSNNSFADYGTMVEIREVQYFPDGRAIINTVGNQRFRVVRKGMRDGYNTASVEFLVDEAIQENEMDDVTCLHNTVHEAVVDWFDRLHNQVQQCILSHFGTMPELEENWPALENGPAWYWWAVAILPLDKRAQLSILAMTTLRRRLETLQRVLNYLHQRQSC